MFASKDDPRRKLRDTPARHELFTCKLQVRLIYPGGQEQTVDVETIATQREQYASTVYHGEAIDAAAKTALFQYGRQFRSGMGIEPGFVIPKCYAVAVALCKGGTLWLICFRHFDRASTFVLRCPGQLVRELTRTPRRVRFAVVHARVPVVRRERERVRHSGR